MKPLRSKASEVLTDLEIDAVINLLMHYMSMDMRHHLMAQCPTAYVKLNAGIPGIEVAALTAVATSMGLNFHNVCREMAAARQHCNNHVSWEDAD